MNARSLTALMMLLAACGDPAPRDLNRLGRWNDLYIDPMSRTPVSGPVVSSTDLGGQTLETRGFLKGGIWDGPVELYLDGQLYQKGAFSAGEQDGPWAVYENGDLRSRSVYSNGERHGPYEEYGQDGHVALRGSYAQGREVGTWEIYENGRLKSRSVYSNGRLEGPFESFHPDGSVELKGTYSQGELDGFATWYDQSGEVIEEGVFSNGAKCGEWDELGDPVTYPPCPAALASPATSGGG